jgi:hypothetical protein
MIGPNIKSLFSVSHRQPLPGLAPHVGQGQENYSTLPNNRELSALKPCLARDLAAYCRNLATISYTRFKAGQYFK